MKQISKIRQFADKAFIRQDKNDVLTEDLQKAELRIDIIKKTCENTAKKVSGCLFRQEKDTLDKRVHKVPEVILGMNMVDNSRTLLALSDDPSVLGEVLDEAGKIELKLGNEFVNFEIRIEQQILNPLKKILDVDLPNISKTKKILVRLVQDMEVAKAKFLQVSRHSVSSTGMGKIDNVKEELEDLQQKVEQSRDHLASEMFTLISRESEISQFIIQFLYIQRDYHKNISDILCELLPCVETALQTSMRKPVFGVDLVEHLQATQRTIAYPLELCACGLLLTALEEEGLFRIAGGASKVKKIKSAFDASLIDLNGVLTFDAHVISTAFKCFLRELPMPLLTFQLYEEWVISVKKPDGSNKTQAIKDVLSKLPKPNYDNLRYLVKFLYELSKHQNINKMSPANIAIVIGPNILWCQTNSDDPLGPFGDMTMTHYFSSIMDQLITHCDEFFPEDIEFFITCSKPSEQEINRKKSINSSSILLNGLPNNIDESNEQQNQNHFVNIKRTQSNSSLEENSPPLGNSPHSPILPVRRKNKAAPAPPAFVNKVSATSSSSLEQIKQPNNSLEHKHSFKTTVIPPPPSQMFNKNLTTNTNQLNNETTTTTGGSKCIPPTKPPPPAFYQIQQQQQEIKKNEPPPKPASPLKYKSSFKANENKSNSPESTPSSVSDSPIKGNTLNYNSLPRHFHTTSDNTTRNQKSPRPPSVFSASGLPPPPPPPTIANTSSTVVNSHSEETLKQNNDKQIEEINFPQPQVKKDSSSSLESSGSEVKSIGFEKVNHEVSLRRESEEKNLEEEVKIPTTTTTTTSVSDAIKAINLNSNESSAFVRPVPAPRSSLLNQSFNNKDKERDNIPSIRERPVLMAKPRDLSKKNSSGITTNEDDKDHERKESGSSGESDNPENYNISTSTSLSRNHSLSLHSSSEDILDENSLNKNDLKTQLSLSRRPARPTPPPPPKNQNRPPSAGESTDL